MLGLGASYRLVPGVVGGFHDDAVYAITAKALAHGDGYRLVNLPGAPPQTKYPILYPAVLAGLWLAAPNDATALVAMQVMTGLAAAAAIAVAYLYVAGFGYVRRNAAFAAALVCASAPNLLYYATAVLSEMPFALLLVASLWATDAYLADPAPSPARALVTGVVAALPFLCRTVGVVVPVAACLAIARAKRPVAPFAVAAAVTMAPWILWMLRGTGQLAVSPIVGYQQDYLGHWSTGYFGYGTGSRVALAVWLFGTNLVKACTAVGDIALEGVAPFLYAHAAWTVTALGALAWLAALVGVVQLALLPTTLLAYLALVCAWPWPPDRFVIPVLFFLVAALLDGAARAVEHVAPRRAASLVVAAAVAIAVVGNVGALARYAEVARSTHYPFFVPPDEPVRWSAYADAFAWLRGHAAAADVLAAGFDSMTALYTDHPTIRPFVARPSTLYYGGTAPALGSTTDLAGALATYRPRYLFVSPLPAFPEEEAMYELVSAFQRERPGDLQRVYQGSDPRFVIFAVRPSQTAGGEP